MGESDMEKLNGVVETHYSNGQLSIRETYKNGNRDGMRETWLINGELWSSAIYKDGVAVE